MKLVPQFLAILLLPGTVIIVIPALIVSSSGAVNVGWSLPPLLSAISPILGLLLIGIGLVLMFKTVALFASTGKGTLAPWDPPQKLVVRGVYCHVRNPMISGVLGILLGEAVFLGSLPLLEWFALFLAANLTYIPLLEEPVLTQRFGDDYFLYKKNVPRWIPRLTPWETLSDERRNPNGAASTSKFEEREH